MDFQFLHAPKPRKFNYKPQFYNPDAEDQPEGTDNTVRPRNENEDFGKYLHDSWDRRRQQKKGNNNSSIKSIVWTLFIIIVLLFLFYKILVKI